MPRITKQNHFYKLCRRLFFNSLHGRIMNSILGNYGNIAQMDEDDINFFAILYLHTINTHYFDCAFSYIANSYIILESAMDMSDSNFLLHFWMENI